MSIRVALIQMAVPDQSLKANLDLSMAWIDRAVALGADWVVFPEIHLTRFFPQYENRQDLAVPLTLDSEEIQRLQQHCREKKVVCFPNVYLKESVKKSGVCYDASLVIDRQGSLLGTAKMVHIAQQPLFYEQDYYAPSPEGFRVFEVDGVRVGVVVCFDRHYPESFRACAKQGAEVVVIPTANTLGEPLDVFDAELQAAAYQNNLFVVMANRVGQEDQMHFAGASIAIDPHGQILKKAGQQETILCVDLDVSEVQKARQKRPYLSLLRPDLY
jgi:beta-ureidopropionase